MTSASPELIHTRFDPAALEVWTPTQTFLVDPDQCVRYAAATNEVDPQRWATGIAPPLLCVAATVPHVQAVLEENLSPQILAENRSVHGEHDIYYHQPVVPGSTLLVRGRLYGVHPRSTGTVFVTQVQLTDPESGALVHEEQFVNFLRGVMTDTPIGVGPSAHRLPNVASLGDPLGVETYAVDADQTYRYAEASGDHSIYHLDDDAARAAGFRSIIVHGLCTMAFASRAVVAHACGGDAARLRRLAVRFSRPLYPGHEMTTTLWSESQRDHSDELGSYRFQVTDDEGAAVITDGLAVVDPIPTNGESS